MSKKVTVHLSGMTDRELLRAYDLQLRRANYALRKGNKNYSTHVKMYQYLLDEYFDRIEKQVEDFGDNPLDRRVMEGDGI